MENISQRDAFWGKVYALAKEDKSIVLVIADMGAPALDKFRTDLSAQYIDVGIAEQQARLRAETEAEEARITGESQEQLAEEPAQAATGLLAEIEANRKIANEPWTGTLAPFQTDVWDASPSELHALPTNLREDLAKAYSDIQLANSIVWLARELKRRSPNLDENYSKLCTNIATRLEAVIPRLEQANK